MKKVLSFRISIQDAKRLYNTQIVFLKTDPIEKFVRINDFFSQNFFIVSQNIIKGPAKENYENKLNSNPGIKGLALEKTNLLYDKRGSYNGFDVQTSPSSLNTLSSDPLAIKGMLSSEYPNKDKNQNFPIKSSYSQEMPNQKKSLVRCSRCQALFNGNICTVCKQVRKVQ
jgi:hypothetical protein